MGTLSRHRSLGSLKCGNFNSGWPPIALDGLSHRRLAVLHDVAMREGAEYPLVGVWRNGCADPLHGGAIERNVVGIAAHEADETAVLGHLEVVADEQVAAAVGAAA